MEIFCSDQVTELAKAMMQVQKSIQPAPKDAKNPFTKSTYATLNSVMESCRAILLANDIWLTQYPVPVEPGHLGLATKITHSKSGQWQSSLLVMPLPKNDPQGYGSALTYARRYALSALIGIVAEQDDDGELASSGRASPTKHRHNRPPSRSQQQPTPNPPSSPPQPYNSHPQSALINLPKLDGVHYETVKARDGRLCILASGQTNPKKDFLLEAGFQWNSQKKAWWRYADAS